MRDYGEIIVYCEKRRIDGRRGMVRLCFFFLLSHEGKVSARAATAAGVGSARAREQDDGGRRGHFGSARAAGGQTHGDSSPFRFRPLGEGGAGDGCLWLSLSYGRRAAERLNGARRCKRCELIYWRFTRRRFPDGATCD